MKKLTRVKRAPLNQARAELRDIVRYICAAYPQSGDLSNTRVTKIVYLADWRAALAGLGQISNVRWGANAYGPWAPEVYETAKNDPLLEVNAQRSHFWPAKQLIGKRPDADINADTLLDRVSRAILDSVFADTQDMHFGQFIDYVSDTEPAKWSHRKGALNLAAFARSYGQQPVPVDLAAAGISPTDYARARATIDLKLAQALLGQPLRATTEVSEHRFTIHQLPGLRIDELTLDRRMDVSQQGPNRWAFRAEGEIRLSALLSSAGGLPPALTNDGYYIYREDWIPGQNILGLKMRISADFAVTKRGNVDAEPIGVLIGPVKYQVAD